MLTSSLRARPVIAVATVAALLMTGGAAWALWQVTGSQAATTAAQNATDLRLVGRPDPNRPLYPGVRVDLAVTVHNDNPFPVLVNVLRMGNSPVTADPPHRDAGCIVTGVALVTSPMTVTWRVNPNTKKDFILTEGLTMSNDSDSACQGAAFSVPLTASGRSNVS
ncbi:hypothetical protein [Actinoplanes sp. CA-252034]|uniref:hypothetical protein n=1 Tax=Actinoplanes sp. CA-252034 TaxID=3239906 RepID=UPI003D982AFD